LPRDRPRHSELLAWQSWKKLMPIYMRSLMLPDLSCRRSIIVNGLEPLNTRILKKDFKDMHPTYDVMVKEKAEVKEITKLQRFQDSLRKKLAELRRDTEASVATLIGRSAEFPTDASLSDFLEWF
jgi:hypothetical protein